MRGDSDTVQTLEDNNGLVIDTRDLYRLALAVQASTITPEAARTVLLQQRGIASYPPSEVPTTEPPGR